MTRMTPAKYVARKKDATGGGAATPASTSGVRSTPNHKKETVMVHDTPPPLTSDDVTYYRHVIAGNFGQTLTVEVVSLVDDGQATPPVLTTHGNLDMTPDQVVELTDALEKARTAWDTAHQSWIEGL